MFRHNNPFKRTVTKTLNANGGSENISLFTVSGSVDMIIYGVVTTGLADNLTNAYFNIWDGTSKVDLTDSAVGATLSLLPAGSVISKMGLVTDVADIANSSAGVVKEHATDISLRKVFNVTAKNGATTTVRFTYTATGVASGAIQFFIEYIPRSQGAIIS